MQSYVEIPSGNTLQESLAKLLNNDKTALSSSSGTVFPTTNLHVGMLCYRTDEQKIYLLKDTVGPTWILLLDLTNERVKFSNGLEAGSGVDGGIAFNDGIHRIGSGDGDAFFHVRVGHKYDTDLGALRATESGFVGVQSYDKTTGTWRIHTSTASIAVGDTPTFAGLSFDPNGIRFNTYTVWHSNNDGAESGLDADLLDGQHGTYYAPIQNPNFVGSFGSTSENANINLGSKATTNAPYIDFHSSGNDVDYDSRIIATGGNATLGGGTLNYQAALHAFTGPGDFNGPLEAESLGIGTSASGVAGEIRATNNVTGYYSSDARLKTNVREIENALPLLKKLRGVRYQWTDEYIKEHGGEDGFFVRRDDVGLIAQEVETVLPEIVVTRPDGYRAMKYDRVVALLIQAVKELSAKVEALEAA